MASTQKLADLFRQQKSADDPYKSYQGGRNLSTSINSLFSNATSITEEDVMKIPTIVAGLELIQGAFSQLPVELYKLDENGNPEKAKYDNRVKLINSEPNNSMTGNAMKRKIAKDYIFYGASYFKIDKLGLEYLNLFGLETKKVIVDVFVSEGYKRYANFRLSENYQKTFSEDEIMCILKNTENGYTSRGILENNADILNLALQEQKYSTNVLSNGALPVGALTSDAKLTPEVLDRLKDSWASMYAGAGNAGKTMILEQGMKYTPISMKPADLQLSDTKKTLVSDIARILNIPESMLNPDANKYSSNEQNNLYFLQYCLSPIITATESALNRWLLLETEKEQGWYFSFDVTEILRSTAKERTEEAVEGLKGGIYSLNEARAKTGQNQLENDFMYISLGQVLYNPDEQMLITPNTGQVLKINDGGAEVLTAGTTKDRVTNQPVDIPKDETSN